MPNFIRKKQVCTRKEHQCFACLDVYPIGTHMTVSVNTDCGEIYSLYSCEICETLMNTYAQDLWDYAESCFNEGCVHDALRKGQTKEQLLKEWKTYYEKYPERLKSTIY